ncbi:hypothetical protein ACCQ21_14260 [Xanthomonas axonopodis pv. desmodiigangetici]|uniref:hypothetical protein n=1 Tax=Xanthomonas axonopodis TaxID=53413 RepID=UPI003558AC75
MEGQDQAAKEETASASETLPSIIDKPVPLTILDDLDWEAHLADHDCTNHRWGASQLTDQRSEMLAEEATPPDFE